jgi:hypothetical protein
VEAALETGRFAPSRARRWIAPVACAALATVLPIVLGPRGDGIDASCDEGVVRVIGRGYTGLFRGLDAIAALAFGGHPEMVASVCAGLVGLATFVIARRLARAISPGALSFALAVVASALATLTLPMQREAGLVSGNTMGALLVMAPLALAAARAPNAFIACALGLAATYDVPVFATSAVALGAWIVVARKRPRWTDALFLIAGVAPIAWMLWRRSEAPDASLDVALFSSPLGEGARTTTKNAAIAIARGELGVVALAFAALGAVFGVRSRITRPLTTSMLAVAAIATVFPAIGAPSGPARFGATLLAGLAAVSVLAAIGMATVARLVSKAKIPLARASAAMIVLLEIAVPVRVFDDAQLALAKAPHDATAKWNASVFGELPKRAIVLVPSARLLLRARAAAAIGMIPEDVIVVPTWGLGSRATGREIAREPLLAPLVRDLALYGAPEEFSLSQLAAARPLLVAFDARWDKRFARHLVPQGAFDRYFVEPRGASERMKAFATIDEATVTALRASPALADATRDLLQARKTAASSTAEKDYLAAATVELERLGSRN